MKKIACLLACCCMASFISLTAFAKESAVRIAKERITLSETQTTFEAVVEIEPENAYAGVEIGLACPDSVAVTASSGSSGSMSAGPVLANGLYWTSFFESDNKLSGLMKITLRFSCPKEFERGDIRIEEVKVLTKDGVSVVTEKREPSLKVHIARNGPDSTEPETAGKPAEPDNTTEPGTAGKPAEPDNILDTTDKSSSSIGEEDTPATGDNGRLSICIALLLVSACGVLGMKLFQYKKAN